MTIEVKGVRFGEGIPKICVSFMPHSLQSIETEWNALKEYDFDILEWRMDYFQKIKEKTSRMQAVHKIRELVDKPLLSTFRTSNEGGEMDVSIDEYIQINQDMVHSGCIDLIDVEVFINEKAVETIIEDAHKHAIYVIGSNHDFENTPDYKEIIHRLNFMKEKEVDISKVAYMPKDKQDVITVLEATSDFQKSTGLPIISMAMGEEGKISRVCGELFGSCMTFGCVNNASAPGQIHVKDLKKLLDVVHCSM